MLAPQQSIAPGAALDPSEAAVYGNRFRQKRFGRFVAIVDEIIAAKGRCRILDIGGKYAYWQALSPLWNGRDCHITLVNLEAEAVPEGRFASTAGYARDLHQFANGAFDVVHSNSVIEHVGLWRDQCRMAQEVRRLAPRYFVQTPNFWFPIEPHFRTPFIHWLPDPLRVAIVMRRRCGFYPRADPATRPGTSSMMPACWTPMPWLHCSRMRGSSANGSPGLRNR